MGCIAMHFCRTEFRLICIASQLGNKQSWCDTVRWKHCATTEHPTAQGYSSWVGSSRMTLKDSAVKQNGWQWDAFRIWQTQSIENSIWNNMNGDSQIFADSPQPLRPTSDLPCGGAPVKACAVQQGCFLMMEDLASAVTFNPCNYRFSLKIFEIWSNRCIYGFDIPCDVVFFSPWTTILY